MTTVRNLRPASHEGIAKFLQVAENIILGKPHELRWMLTCVLANGHLLIEDVPGVGKTTFVKTLQALCGLSFSRIQFTNDLLPADILGGAILNRDTHEFNFRKGPIFCQLLLADEINRATPKSQSACLQAMEEKEISVDGQTHRLPQPFFVVATQNPKSSIGTFPLPESQLDRFMMRIRIGFPSREAEKKLLTRPHRKTILDTQEPILTSQTILELQEMARTIHVSDPIISYIQDIVALSRTHEGGLSPRAALDLVAASKAFALIDGRDFVKPQDVQDVAIAVINHRIAKHDQQSGDGWDRAMQLLGQVKVR